MAGRQDPAPRQVMAWGTSVLASAMVAGLGRRPGLELRQVEPTLPAAIAALGRWRTHAVVCDLASVPAGCILALLETHPHLTVVIVDPDAERALVLTCRRPRMRTIDDLVAALLVGHGGREPPAPGPGAART